MPKAVHFFRLKNSVAKYATKLLLMKLLRCSLTLLNNTSQTQHLQNTTHGTMLTSRFATLTQPIRSWNSEAVGWLANQR